MQSRRVLSSLLANWYGVGVTIITQLIQIPIFLSFWQKELYGDWLILFSIPSILIFADFGIASVTANRISMAVGRGEIDTARKVLHSGFALIALGGAAICVGVTAGAFLFDVRAFFGISSMPEIECQRTLAIFGIIVVFWLSQPLLLGIFQGNDAFALGTFLTNSVRLLMLPAIAGALLLDGRPVAVAGSMLVTQILGYGAAHFFCWLNYPALRCGITAIDRPLCRTLMKEGISAFGVTLSSVVSQHGMTLVVARTMGPADVVTFAAVRTLTRTAALVASSVRSALLPEFAFRFGRRDFVAWRRLLVTATLRLSGFAFVAAVALVVLGPMILQIWTKDVVIVSWTLMVPFVFASLLQSIALVANGAVFSTNQTRILSSGLLLASFGGVTSCFFLSQRFGMEGIGVGAALGELAALVAVSVSVVYLYSNRTESNALANG